MSGQRGLRGQTTGDLKGQTEGSRLCIWVMESLRVGAIEERGALGKRNLRGSEKGTLE